MEKRGVGGKGEERESSFLLKRQTTCCLLGPGANFLPFTHTSLCFQPWLFS